MLKWFGGLIDRISAVAGALVFMQFPLFFAQYTQQLSGREAELFRQVNSMREAASLSGKSLEQYIFKFIQSSDSDFAMQGKIMQALVTRWHTITDSLLALKNSTIWGRPWAFFSHLDSETFHSTFQQYTFGLPFNLEGGIYALLGIFIGYSLCSILAFLMRKSFLMASPKSKIR